MICCTVDSLYVPDPNKQLQTHADNVTPPCALKLPCATRHTPPSPVPDRWSCLRVVHKSPSTCLLILHFVSCHVMLYYEDRAQSRRDPRYVSLRITGSPDHLITGSRDQRISGSPDQRFTRSPDHRITGSPGHRFTSSPDLPLTGPLLYITLHCIM